MSKKTPEIVLHPEISKWRCTPEDKNLRRDLKERGQLQNMVFRKLPNGKLQLLAGNSRYRELTTLNVPFEKWDMKILENISDRDALLIAMSENRFRRKLSAVEEGRMFRSMKKNKMHLEEIAVRYRCSETYVKTRLELLKLPRKIQDSMEKGTIPMSYGKPLGALNDLPKYRKLMLEEIQKGQESSYSGIHSVEDCNEFVEKVLATVEYLRKLVAEYGPCPKCGSEDINATGYETTKHHCNKCGYVYHRDTKEPWDFYVLKRDAEKLGLTVDIGEGKAKIKQEDVAAVIDRIKKEKEKDKKIPKTLRSTFKLGQLLAPFVKPAGIYMFRVERDKIEIKLISDTNMRFSCRRHKYKTGEKTRIKPLTMWDNEQNKGNPARVKRLVETLEFE